MHDSNPLKHPGYDPAPLLEHLITTYHLANDAALARALDLAPACLSKIRSRKLGIGATLQLRIHDTFGLDIREIKRLMGNVPAMPLKVPS